MIFAIVALQIPQLYMCLKCAKDIEVHKHL